MNSAGYRKLRCGGKCKLKQGLAFLLLALGSVFSHPSILAASADPSLFGVAKMEGASLIGILYDLKQDQYREKTKMGAAFYDSLVNEYLSSDWDEAVLNRYFRVTMPLYTTQVFIPKISASSAPVAFGVKDVVHPSYWVVHYKGQVSPPTSGSWRFWGFGSEVCSVAVNGRTVLASNWIENGRPIPTPKLNWRPSDLPGQRIRQAHLVAGDWMNLKAGEIIDLDILIGERAGGNFCAVLLIEKKGDKYEMKNGHPILPVFQLAPFTTPIPKSHQLGPQISHNGPIWKAIK